MSPEKRKALELRAVAIATEFYTDQGWDCEGVGDTESFDIRCLRYGAELRVEVKGSTNKKLETIIVTSNEVSHACLYPHVALFVVEDVLPNLEQGD